MHKLFFVLFLCSVYCFGTSVPSLDYLSHDSVGVVLYEERDILHEERVDYSLVGVEGGFLRDFVYWVRTNGFGVGLYFEFGHVGCYVSFEF